ncbi:Transcriptional regulator, contains XRE-family HTH domain [Limimonas halophila]|uniref:Transcriptional regulator, contains XRE-family HTH domain n=1 Tax=Limimonas halophila TaxID=1082479 RepID=A0A1G7UW11_9PROT|nr:helix-turn-helix transcriptional regulator [Limimonas halophila]SDG51471.1 Transcriptional regulator, contains XRE-family HTH domain [Limimonas halophila]
MPSPSDTREIDTHVGGRIRQRRIMLGMTQHQLADRLGITYQQAHKYERGLNRISAGRLYQLARVLDVEVGYFYQGLDDTAVSQDASQRLCLDMARNFSDITDERKRHALAQLTRTLADRERGTESEDPPDTHRDAGNGI